MSSAELENLARIGSLERVPASEAEIEALAASGRARLGDAADEGLSLTSRFDLAYNGTHALALAALRRLGYRSKSRYLVFLALEHTLELSSRSCRVLIDAHRERNRVEYEGVGSITESLVEALLEAGQEVLSRFDVSSAGETS
jgi:hypothetical protein